MRVSTFQIYQQGVNSMLDQQSALAKTQLQLATGNKNLAPSDNPAETTKVLELSQIININGQYQKNADSAQALLVQEETVLAQTGNLLQRVRELAVQGLNGTNSPEDRKAISFEVKGILEELLQAANSKDSNNTYLFAGYKKNTEPFIHDGNGGFSYQGDQGQNVVQIGPSRRVSVSDSGEKVFTGLDDGNGGKTDIFSIVYEFASDLDVNAPNSATLDKLDVALDRVLTTRSSVGARLNSIESQRNSNAEFDVLLKENKSRLKDLDYAEAVSRFERQTIALQAAQQSFVKIEGLSLFNYL